MQYRRGRYMKYRPEYDLKVIGKNLKRLREAKNLSVADVQEYLKLGTRQAIYKYESGKGYPQADTMLALMELYGADLHDIVDDHGKEKENPDKPARDKVTEPVTEPQKIEAGVCKDKNPNSMGLQKVDYMIYMEEIGVSVIEVESLDTFNKKNQMDRFTKYYELLTKHKAG